MTEQQCEAINNWFKHLKAGIVLAHTGIAINAILSLIIVFILIFRGN